jgi:urate oxidase
MLMSRHTVAVHGLPVLRVVRRGDRHTIHDLHIDVMLDVGDVALAPDTHAIARAVHALAGHHAGGEPEAFATTIAQHALTHFEHVRHAVVEVAVHGWERLAIGGRPRDRDLVGASADVRIARVTADHEVMRVAAGFRDMRLLTAEASALLPLIELSLDAVWTYGWTEIPFDTHWQQVRRTLTDAYAERAHIVGAPLAHSLAKTVLDASPAVQRIEVRLRTARHTAVDMMAFGMENVGEVFGERESARGACEVALERAEIAG